MAKQIGTGFESSKIIRAFQAQETFKKGGFEQQIIRCRKIMQDANLSNMFSERKLRKIGTDTNNKD